MRERDERLVRWFVGISLLLGGVALLAGALALGTGLAGEATVFGLVAAAVAVMLLTIVFEATPRWPWFAPAALPILLLMAGILWARYEDAGHVFLSGLAPFVAFLTGYGILKRRPWAWPVALVSVAGAGPTLLLFAPLDPATIAGAFVLFAADALLLLALGPSTFQPSRIGA